MKTGFDDLRKDLRPLVTMASAGKFLFGVFVASVSIMVGVIAIGEKVWTFLTQR